MPLEFTLQVWRSKSKCFVSGLYCILFHFTMKIDKISRIDRIRTCSLPNHADEASVMRYDRKLFPYCLESIKNKKPVSRKIYFRLHSIHSPMLEVFCGEAENRTRDYRLWAYRDTIFHTPRNVGTRGRIRTYRVSRQEIYSLHRSQLRYTLA